MQKDEIAIFMADMFEIPENKLSTNNTEDINNDDFEQKSQDLNLIIEKETEEVLEKEPVKNITEKKEPAIKTKPSKKIKQDTNETKQTVDENIDENNILQSTDPLMEDNQENPLNLQADDLEHYQTLNSNYPFILYDGNVGMKKFYRYKVRELGYLLSNAPLLDCKSLIEECKNININHSIEGIPHPETLSKELSNVQRQRERLGDILIQIHQQYHLWDQATEMLKGELWIVKDLKGQHKREGLVLEHMADIIHYLGNLKRTLETAKYIENLLDKANDTLSRQISCLESGKKLNLIDYNDSYNEKTIKNMDTINEGTEIEASSASQKGMQTGYNLNFGLSESNDNFSDIG